ncbi:MAG: hypothetical protein IKT89_06705 [Clostridia bacterium]|nr:hypothetical protein [Clostridia bacterium]
MKDNAKEYLVKARANLLSDDEAEAIGCYGVLAIEEPDNGEAAFFVAYADYVGALSDFADGKGSSADIKTAFYKIESSLEYAVESVVKSEGKIEEKLAVIEKISKIYIPLPNYVITNKIGGSSDIEARVMYLYWFASYIENGFNSNKEAMKIAINPLKEAVKLQQKFYAYKYDGIKVEDTAARIQKIDPSYTIPKKAGCVTLG